MAYDTKLADRIRTYLDNQPDLVIEEKEMFKGLTFMVNGKMCVSVSGEELMVRFDPALQNEIAEQQGFRSMQMKNKEYKGYGYVDPTMIRTKKQFEYWMKLCLDFNPKAKASKKK
jgi:TfoX/Sxy family transcriptional regulator of competence genes